MQASAPQNSLENQSLEQILSIQTLQAVQFLGIGDIVRKVKSKIRLFVQYCSTHQKFLTQIINLTLQTTIDQSSSPQLKNQVHSGLQILNGDIQEIIDMLILNNNDEEMFSQEINHKNNNGNEQSQTTSEKYYNYSSDKQEKFLNKFNYSYRFFIQLLNCIYNQPINEVSINYVTSIINSIIKRKPHQIMDFFYIRKDLINQLLQQAHRSCISNTLVKLIAQQDQKNLENHCQVRDLVMDGMIHQLKSKIGDSDQFQGYLQFVEETFNSNRSSYADGIQNFKKNANKLTSQSTLHYFLSQVKQNKGNVEVGNSMLFLLMVMRRMGVDEEIDRDSEFNGVDQKVYKPTMEFYQHELYNSMSDLIETALKANNWDKCTKMSFFELLYLMTKHKQFQQYKYPYKELVTSLLTIYQNESHSKGLHKFYIQSLIQNLMSKVPKIQQEDVEKFLPLLKSLLETYNYNKNPNNSDQRSFLSKMLLIFDNYSPQFSKNIPQVNIQQIRQSYSVRLSSASPPNYKYNQFSFLVKRQLTPQVTQPVPQSSNHSSEYGNETQYIIQKEEVHVINLEQRIQNNKPISTDQPVEQHNTFKRTESQVGKEQISNFKNTDSQVIEINNNPVVNTIMNEQKIQEKIIQEPTLKQQVNAIQHITNNTNINQAKKTQNANQIKYYVRNLYLY